VSEPEMQNWHVTFWFDTHPGLAAYLAAHLPDALKSAEDKSKGPVLEAKDSPAGLWVSTTVVEQNAYAAFVVGAERMRVALRSVGISVPEVSYDFGPSVRVRQAQVFPRPSLSWSTTDRKEPR